MEKLLEKYFYTASPVELAVFDADFESIARASEADDTETVLRRSLKKAGINRRRPTLKKRLAIMIAAAMILIPAAAAAASYINKLEKFFGVKDQTSPFANEFVRRQASVENDDARLTVDGVLSDEFRSYLLITFEAKSELGKQYVYDCAKFHDTDDRDSVKRQNAAMMPYMNIYRDAPIYFDSTRNFVFYQEHKGTIWEGEEWYYEGESGEIKYRGEYTEYDKINAVCLKLILDKNDLDTSKPVTLIEAFSGLKTDIDVSGTVESIKLVSDDPKAFHDVKLSPYAVYIHFDERDTKYPYSFDSHIFKVTFVDGHTEEIREVHGNSPHPAGDFDLTTHEGWVEYGKYSYSDLRFKAPINTEDFVSIEIDGILYRPEREE